MGSAASSKCRVLVVGATGLLGSAIVARLKAEGMFVVALVRTAGHEARRLQPDRLIVQDLRDLHAAQAWEPHLDGISVVINCAGTLQDSSRDSTSAVHSAAPSALFEACERGGIRRVIHFSAMGVDQGGLTAFSRTKAVAETVLQRSSLDWVILRPAVVVGRAAYGGSALFRGLAGLPWLPQVSDTKPISVVQLDDVVETTVRLLAPDAPKNIALELAGPQPLEFATIVARYRAWLGWRPARIIRAAGFLMPLSYRVGDVAGWLGWRPAVRTTAQREITRGAVGDPAVWTQVTGIVPQSLDDALAREPASVQERWFANLFLLKPLVMVAFALFWLVAAFTSLGPGYDLGVAMMQEGGAGALSGPLVIAGGLADLLIGLGILWRRTTRHALWAAVAVTVFYMLAGTAILPRLWADPLAPLLKILPVMALNFVALAILEER